MRKAVVAVASLFGAAIGLFWVSAIGAALNGGITFAKSWNVLIYITCPVIIFIWLNAWLVPICNGLLYGSISYVILRSGRLGISK